MITSHSLFLSKGPVNNLWSNFGENPFTLAAFFPKFPKRLGGKLISTKKIKKTQKHDESASAFSCFKTERKKCQVLQVSLSKVFSGLQLRGMALVAKSIAFTVAKLM